MNISENIQSTFRRTCINPFFGPDDQPEEYPIVVEQHRKKVGTGWEAATIRTRTPPKMNAVQAALFAAAQTDAEQIAAAWNREATAGAVKAGRLARGR